MIRLIFVLSVLCLATVTNAHATSPEKQTFYQSLERGMPLMLFGTSYNVAQMQYSLSVGTVPIFAKPVNPFDPSFAECMHFAIVNKDYTPALKATVDDYFANNAHYLDQDLQFLNAKALQSEQQKVNDLFALFAKNDTLAQNHAIFYPRMQNATPVVGDEQPSSALKAILQSEDMPLQVFVAKQIDTCHQVQQLS